MRISEGIGDEDIPGLEKILAYTGYFYDFEIRTALEIAVQTVSQGMDASGYFWIRITEGEQLIGFACYGKNDFSVHSWELYWIAVHQDFRNHSYGRALLQAAEERIRQKGGKILWIETSGRPLYKPTEEFYKKNGYRLEVSLQDFYGPGDPKQIYARRL